MQELHLNLRCATNYLVQLFYRTKERYSCTRSKIDKLMSIVAFEYAVKGQKAFDESIVRYENSGTYISKPLHESVPRDVYNHSKYYDSRRKIVDEEVVRKCNIPMEYMDIQGIGACEKYVIKKVFQEYGAYKTKDLNKIINPIVNHPGVILGNNIVDLSFFAKEPRDEIKVESTESSKLIEYLFKSRY